MRFADIDMMGHVNHARYLGYLEDAHLAFMTTADGPGLELRSVIIARWEVDYVRPALLSDQPLTVNVWVTHVGRSSFSLGYAVEQEGSVAARATSVIVAYDYSRGRSQQLTPAQRAGLERYRAA